MRSSVPCGNESPGTRLYRSSRSSFSAGPTTRRSSTVIQPVDVCHVVSSTIVPGRYRRWSGTDEFDGPKRKNPADRSSSEPKRLGESGRGRQNHSTDPSGATSALTSQSDRNA